MNEKQATAVAEALEGQAWHSGGGIWLVILTREDGYIVCISDDMVCSYANRDAMDAGAEIERIDLL